MKKKILLLSDDLRMTSGVATMSKEIVLGTVNKYDWVQLGAAINHPEIGKIIDLNNDVREKTGIADADVKIVPYNSYGDMIILRKLIDREKPDAILHFTDPHYWQWLYDNEYEIRKKVPLLFYHIWDDLPDPKYNRDYYESCDWIGCISKQTYGIVKRVGKINNKVTHKPLEDWQVSYVPHGINPNVFKPSSEEVNDEVKRNIFGNREFDFILFYNNRNIRRKQPSDVIYSFKLFCDRLPKEKSDRCLLLMHTSMVDNNGTDLNAVARDLCPDYNVKFTNIKIEQDVLNLLYNNVDCTINIANNEGFGLTTAESLMAGTPIIVNVTGGLQDQCGFNENGNEITTDDYVRIKTLHRKKIWGHLNHGEWVVPVWSSAHNLNGSPATPYIFDDRVNDEDVAEAIMTVYNWSKEERKRRGILGREFMMKNLSTEIMCNEIINGIDTAIKNFTPKKNHNLYKIV
jgi:glycosyltransferase involved in cell wall biosynthesis